MTAGTAMMTAAISARSETPRPARNTIVGDTLADMAHIPGGTFRIGSDQHYPEEVPVHHVIIDAFWIDRTPVTNRPFRQFVNVTGWVTFAEITPDPTDCPGALLYTLKAGSFVFTPPERDAWFASE